MKKKKKSKKQTFVSILTEIIQNEKEMQLQISLFFCRYCFENYNYDKNKKKLCSKTVERTDLLENWFTIKEVYETWKLLEFDS